MQRTGALSAEIQESLHNFKVIIAFNRRDYFRNRFNEANTSNYASAIAAGIANNVFIPVYGFFAGTAQLIVLTFGIYLISTGRFPLVCSSAILPTQQIFITHCASSRLYGQASRLPWRVGTGSLICLTSPPICP